MITIVKPNEVLEISQEGVYQMLNVDVINKNGELEYSFELPADELSVFLEQYQMNENIKGAN